MSLPCLLVNRGGELAAQNVDAHGIHNCTGERLSAVGTGNGGLAGAVAPGELHVCAWLTTLPFALHATELDWVLLHRTVTEPVRGKPWFTGAPCMTVLSALLAYSRLAGGARLD